MVTVNFTLFHENNIWNIIWTEENVKQNLASHWGRQILSVATLYGSDKPLLLHLYLLTFSYNPSYFSHYALVFLKRPLSIWSESDLLWYYVTYKALILIDPFDRLHKENRSSLWMHFNNKILSPYSQTTYEYIKTQKVYLTYFSFVSHSRGTFCIRTRARQHRKKTARRVLRFYTSLLPLYLHSCALCA